MDSSMISWSYSGSAATYQIQITSSWVGFPCACLRFFRVNGRWSLFVASFVPYCLQWANRDNLRALQQAISSTEGSTLLNHFSSFYA